MIQPVVPANISAPRFVQRLCQTCQTEQRSVSRTIIMTIYTADANWCDRQDMIVYDSCGHILHQEPAPSIRWHTNAVDAVYLVLGSLKCNSWNQYTKNLCEVPAQTHELSSWSAQATGSCDMVYLLYLSRLRRVSVGTDNPVKS